MKATIIVPVYNAEKTITETMDALQRQSFTDFEIIAVDDGSTDKSAEILRGLEKEMKNLRVLSQKNKGPASARNFGAREAKGEMLVFTDADCVPAKQWLEEMLRPFEGSEIVGVQGKYGNLLKKNTLSRFVQAEIEERYERMSQRKYTDFIGSYSAAYRKDVFLSFGGFDESFPKASGEDPEISYRMAEKGHKMVFNPKAVVLHPHPSACSSYLRQKFWRGYWGTRLYRKHPAKMGGQSYNSAFYFAHIALTLLLLSLAFILIFIYPGGSFYLLLLLLLSSLPSSLKMGSKDPTLLFFSPFLIVLRNLSLGAGIIMGAIKTLNRAERLLAYYLLLYGVLGASTFTYNYLFSDEGTHLLLSLFYRDLFYHILNTGAGFDGTYAFAIDYLVNYPKLQIAYPPLYHIINAAFFSLFGPSAFLGRFVNLTFALLSFLLFYFLGKRFFSERAALLGVIIFSLSPFTLFYALRAFQDFTSVFFFLLAIYIFLLARKKDRPSLYIASGIVAFLAALGKQVGGFSVVVFSADILLRRFPLKEKLKRLLYLLLPFLALLTPYLLVLNAVGGIEINRLVAIGYASVQGEPTSLLDPHYWLYYLTDVTPNFPFYPVFLLLFFIYVIGKKDTSKEFLAYFLIIYLLLSAIANKEQRFVQLFMLPAYMVSAYIIEGRGAKVAAAFSILYALVSLSIFLPTIRTYDVSGVTARIDGNVAILSDDEPLYSSAVMWSLASSGKHVQVFRACAFGGKGPDEIEKTIKGNGIKYVVHSTWSKDDTIEKIKDRLNPLATVGTPQTRIYEYTGAVETPAKKCNYICLTEKWVCAP